MTSRDTFLDRATLDALVAHIHAAAEDLPGPVSFMVMCGTHTQAIASAGLRRRLPRRIRLVAGPGCPTCVTPVAYLDRAQALAGLVDTIVCAPADLLRAPSSRGSLLTVAAAGADVRVVDSPRQALAVARKNPSRRVIFLAIGFEIAIPSLAAALAEAEREALGNFMLLPGLKAIEPALRAVVSDETEGMDGFLLPGHITVIVGSRTYDFLARRRIPSAVVGLKPVDILSGIEELVRQIRENTPRLANLYTRVVRPEGNPRAQRMKHRYFEPVDSLWRGLGTIPASGLTLREHWAHRDASRVEVPLAPPREAATCREPEVLRGAIDPPACTAFGTECTPDRPLGACMVSPAGACGAWYHQERADEEGAA